MYDLSTFWQVDFSCWLAWISFMLEHFLKCLAFLILWFIFKRSPNDAAWKLWWHGPGLSASGLHFRIIEQSRECWLGDPQVSVCGVFLLGCPVSLKKKLLIFCLQVGFQAVQGVREEVWGSIQPHFMQTLNQSPRFQSHTSPSPWPYLAPPSPKPLQVVEASWIPSLP